MAASPSRTTAKAGFILELADNVISQGDSADSLVEGEVHKFLSSDERLKIESSVQPSDVLDGGSF